MNSKYAINKELLEAYKDKITEEHLPIDISEGEITESANGDILVEVLISTDDVDTFNSTLNECINDFYGLTDNE